jgi:hypothetical protein
MKSLTMILTLAALPFAQISWADESAQLTGIGVVFNMPKCDDRDHDTKIDMWIEKNGGRFASAFNLAPGQHFADPGTYGPFPFTLDVAVTKAYYRGSLTKLTISPRGNDTWCTTITITASFSDGSVLKSSTGSAIKVSESNRSAQFVN